MKCKTLLVLYLILFSSNLLISSNDDSSKKINKTNIKEHYTKFNINNISTFIYNNGNADINPYGNSGFVYPNGSSLAAVFESGLVWGGKVNEKILVGGSTYSQGLYGGKILENGKAQDPNDESVRVYRVRPDFKTGNLENEILDENKTEEEIRNQYALDWNEWPAKDGAPFKDIDNDGNYNPEIDIPGVPGASQTLWYVANDLDSNRAKELYGSSTMGIEMQVTVWGYKNYEVVKNMLFKKYILINKSKNTIKDMYVSQWSDPDVGDASDDFVGCDTSLSLGYAYNGDLFDGVYGSDVPAVGFNFLQGPIVESNSSDSAKFNGKILRGYKNLPMTSFSFFIGSDPLYMDPNLANYTLGTLNYYRLMFGLVGTTGEPFIDPTTNKKTVFTLSGDPYTGQGWIDGIIHPPGDRRMLLNSGPFLMEPGDTQEVIVAEIAAGGTIGINSRESVRLLKLYDYLSKDFYDNDFYQISDFNAAHPTLYKSELDKEIILSWYENTNIKELETINYTNFKFQGYTVYQFPSDRFKKSEAKEIFVFDIKDGVAKIISPIEQIHNESDLFEIVKDGTDSGLKRHVSIKKDYLNSEKPLNNGSKYYYGISAYLNNNDHNLVYYPKILESDISTIAAIPQEPKPGESFPNNYGDKIFFYQNDENNFQFKVSVVEPKKIVAGNYKFELIASSNWNNINWNLYFNDNLVQQNLRISIADNQNKYLPFYFNGLEIFPSIFDTTDVDPSKLNYEFTFKSSGALYNDRVIAEKQIKEINVFPNPYYCTQNSEIHQFEKFVTISHLPQKAKIRIFNLAGHLIRTINKDDESQFVRWDLTNESYCWIASGVYLIYIEIPDLKETKILKLAVIMEDVVPDFF